ncbi:TPA: exodeoxyribonuclease III [Candidatus Uhrbacteria bacterium]|nr:exodeoxyribonuclease III [Candidatus Uhrbacteria bacterium]
MPKQTLKIISWNVNGLRAVLRKGTFLSFMDKHRPDILCLQETKAQEGQAEIDLPEYEEIWNSADKKGYAGTAIFTKIKPISIVFNLPGVRTNEFQDEFGNALQEGRVICLEFKTFYLVTVYTPNSKRDLARLQYRHTLWDPAFLEQIQNLETKKPVIFCGDLNAAHQEIDLARPKDNHKNAGFTDKEREGINKVIKAGFIDSFRHFYPEKTEAYTWWSHFQKARERNIGWRIDYIFVSNSLKNKLHSAAIYQNVLGSDHCPVEIEIDLQS